MTKTALYYHPIFEAHITSSGHPERPARVKECYLALQAEGLVSECLSGKVEPANISELELNHSRQHIETVQRLCDQAGKQVLSLGDTDYCSASYSAASHAVGAAITAVKDIAEGRVKNAFVLCRPPGHHAEANQVMGFCFFNNIAIAARYAQQQCNLKRIFILDWDVHHGNGTQHSFESEADVFFCSLHSDPATFYPGTGYAHECGQGPGQGTTLNIPLPAFSSEKDYLFQFDQKILPALEQFRPDIILISAGFDAHKDDPLGNQRLDENSFDQFTDLLTAAAKQYCNGRIVSVLEGGYNLKALTRSVVNHVAALTMAESR